MESWKVWALWAAIGFNVAAGAWSLVAAIRRERNAKRLVREVYPAQMLLPDDGLGKTEWDWFFRKWRENRSRDETLIEAALLRQQRLQSLHQALREKALPLLRLQVAGLDAQGLIDDLDALGEAIQGIAEGPYSPGGM